MKTIYTKRALDKLLYSLLGNLQLVDLWWYGGNKAFDGRTPIDVYHSGEEGRIKVADYILSHCNGQ